MSDALISREEYERIVMEIAERPLFYVLDEQARPVPVPSEPFDPEMYRLQEAQRRVAESFVEWQGQTYRVSTVFLGIDHNFHPCGEPILWETMVLGRERLAPERWHWSGLRTERYASQAAAIAGHWRICGEVARGEIR